MGRGQLRRISPPDDLKRFNEIIHQRRGRLLEEWRGEVRRLPTARNMDAPTLNDHIPSLLDELASALIAGHTESVLDLQLERSPQIHGTQRLRAGFDIVEVVAEYNILREILYGVAEEDGIDLSGDISRILNRVIDRTIALAVDTYAKEKALEMQKRREEHLSFVMHDTTRATRDDSSRSSAAGDHLQQRSRSASRSVRIADERGL
jgi:two-component system phosphate regulon sensor histidine kinase PhoR